jgi:hypothetical protein
MADDPADRTDPSQQRGPMAHMRPPAGDGEPRNRATPLQWLPILGLALALVVTGLIASALAGDDDTAVSGSASDTSADTDDDADDGVSAAVAAGDPTNPPDGTYRGTFTDEYFTAFVDAEVTDNGLVVEIADGVVTAVSGGWTANRVPAQSIDDIVVCRATYASIHDLVEPEPLGGGSGTASVEFLLFRDGFEAQPEMPDGASCDPSLALPIELVLSAEFTFTGDTGRVQFTDANGEQRGLVTLTM